MNAVCSNMSRADILSLRHTSRKVAAVSYDGFSETFDSITVTCSKAGLDRLEALVADAGDQILSKITHVKIHILSAYSLKVLAKSITGESKKYIAAYVRLRKVLIDGLNACPNLAIVTVTNEHFGLRQDPKINPHDIRIGKDFDPLFKYTDRGRYKPHLYGFESVLSVFNVIHKQDLELRLYYAMDVGSAALPFLDPGSPTSIESSSTSDPVRPRIQRMMFGTDRCDIGPIIRKSLRRLTLRGTLTCTQPLRMPQLSFLVAARQSPLTHLNIESCFYNDRTVQALFHKQWNLYPALENIRISDSEMSYDSTAMLQPGGSFKRIEIRDCYNTFSDWQYILATITSALSGKHVQIENCLLHPIAPNFEAIYTFSVLYDHDRRAFVGKATGGEDSDREACFRKLFGAAQVEYLYIANYSEIVLRNCISR